VVSLRYAFASATDSDKYDDAAPLSTSLGPFDIELSDGTLVVRPHDHYADPEQAKDAFEPFLRSWESSAFLQPGRYRIRFNYRTADVVDRNAPPTGGPTVHLKALAGALSLTVGTATLTRSMAIYPSPDASFQASSLTDELISRVRQYYDGRERLTSMANWILSRLEREYGGRRGVPDALNVHEDVVSELGKLAASTDPEHGRKATGKGPPSLSPTDISRLEKIVVRLIRRVGEVQAAGQPGSLPQLTPKDFN
jgi:hypothetical protein